MAVQHELQIRLTGDGSGLTGVLRTATGEVQRFSTDSVAANEKAAQAFGKTRQGVQSISEQLARARTEALAFFGLKFGSAALSELIEMADGWGQLTSRISLATDTTAEQVMVQERLLDISRRSYRAIDETGEVFLRSAGAMREVGFSAEQTLDMVEAVSLGLVVSATNAQAGASVIENFGRAMEMGALRGEQFNSVIANAPALAQALADGLDVSRAELRRMADAGELVASRVLPALTSQLEALRESADSMPTTVEDAITALRNEFSAWLGDINSTVGATALLAAGIELVAEHLGSLVTIAMLVAGVMGVRVVNALIQSAAGWLANTTQVLAYQSALARMAGVTGVVSGGLGAMSLAAGTASVALSTIAPWLTLIVAGGGALYLVYDQWFRATDQVREATDDLDASLQKLERAKSFAGQLAALEEVETKTAQMRSQLAETEQQIAAVERRMEATATRTQAFGAAGDMAALRIGSLASELANLTEAQGTYSNSLAEAELRMGAVQAAVDEQQRGWHRQAAALSGMADASSADIGRLMVAAVRLGDGADQARENLAAFTRALYNIVAAARQAEDGVGSLNFDTLTKSLEADIQALERQRMEMTLGADAALEWSIAQELGTTATEEQSGVINGQVARIKELRAQISELTVAERQQAQGARAAAQARKDTERAAREFLTVQRDILDQAADMAAQLAGPVATAQREHEKALTAIRDRFAELQRLQHEGRLSTDELSNARRALIEIERMLGIQLGNTLASLEDEARVTQNLVAEYRALTSELYMTDRQLAMHRAEMDAIAQAKRLGITLTRDEIAAVRAAAGGYHDATDAVRRHEEAYRSLEAASAEVSSAIVAQWRGDTQSISTLVKRWIDQLIAEFLRLRIVQPLIMGLFGGSGGGLGLGMIGAAGSALMGGGGSIAHGGTQAVTAASGAGTSWGGLMEAGTWARMGKNLFGGFSEAWAASMSGSGSSMFGSWTGGNFVGPLAPGQAAHGTWAPSMLGQGVAAAGGLYAGYNRWQGSDGGIAGAAGAAAYGVGTYYAGMGMMAASTGGLAAGAAAIPVIGWVALVAMVVDMVAGGKLFGTSYRPESVEQTMGIDAAGGYAQAEMTEVRQRSLFRGRSWRTSELNPGDDATRAADQFFNAVRMAMTDAAMQMAADVEPVIDASIRTITEFDKKGRETSTQYFVDAIGRTWEEATAELAAQRVLGEAIIAQVAGSAGDQASAVAERWRHSAETLLEGAHLLVAAQADINRGQALVGDDLGAVADLVERNSQANEQLADTYQRLAAATQLLEQALSLSNGALDLARDEFVQLAADIADAAGGIDRASQLWSGFFAAYYDSVELSVRQLDALLGQRDSALASIGLDPGTSMDAFRAAFESGMAEMTAQEIARWLEVAGVLAEATQAQQQYALAIIDSTDSLETILAGATQALDAATPSVIDWGAAMADLEQRNTALIDRAIALGASEGDLEQIRAFAQLRVDELAAAEAMAAAEAAALQAELDDAMLIYEDFRATLTDRRPYQSAHAAIMRERDQQLAQAHELARAAGLQGAATRDVGRIHLQAAAQVVAATLRIRAAIQDILGQLTGGGMFVPGQGYVEQALDDFESGATGAIGRIDDAAARMYQAQLAGIQRISDYLTSMQFGGLSALSPMEQLDAARQQLEVLQQAALAGDADAMSALPQAAQQYLQLLQGAYASGDQFGAGYDWVQQLLQAVVDQGPAVDDPGAGGTGTWDGYPGLTPDALRERDGLLVAQEAEYRAALAGQLAEHLGQLAELVNAPVLELAGLLGVSLESLVADLGVNLQDITGASVLALAELADALGLSLGILAGELGLELTDLGGGIGELLGNMGHSLDEITGSTVEAMAGLGAMLGLSLGEMVTALGLELTDLAGGLTELTTELGIELDALTVESTQALAALAAQLGFDLSEMTTALGVDLGELTDSQSLLNQTFAAELAALPDRERDLLAPLFSAVTDATSDADANAAIAELEGAVNDLSPAIREQLAPYLEGVFPADAMSDLDFLGSIDSSARALESLAGQQLSSLNSVSTSTNAMRSTLSAMDTTMDRIRSNLREQNRDAGLPHFAAGGWVRGRTTLVAGEAGDELILPAHVSSFLAREGIPLNSAAPAADTRELAARLERIEAAIERSGQRQVEATVGSGRAVAGAVEDLRRSDVIRRTV